MKQTLTAFFSALVFLSSFTSTANAQTPPEPKIITVKAIVSEPLNLYIFTFNEKKPFILKGQIKSPKISNPIQSISFSITGKNHETLWTGIFPWEKKFQKSTGEIVINFEHNIKESRISGKNILSVRLIDIENQVIAIKSKEISFPKLLKSPLSEILNIKTKKGETAISVKVDFINKTEEKEFYAKVDVYKDASRTEKIKELKTASISLKYLKATTFSFDFPKPDTPHFYITDVRIFDSNDIAQSGTLSSGFLIDGLFALIEFSDITPKKFLLAGESADIKVKGTINTYVKDLSILISARTKEIDPDAESQFFENEFPIEIDKYRNFSETFLVPVKWETEQIWANIKIKKGGQILAEETISSKKHIAPDDFLINVITNPFETLNISQASKTKVIIGGSIALLLLITFIILIMKIIKKKKTLSILFIAVCFSSSAASAAAIVEPTFNYYRTTNLPIDEPFNKVTVQGEITGGSGILNIGEEYTTEFEMTRQEDSQPLTVAGENLDITDTDQFSVTFNAADAKLGIEPLVLDSDYTLTKITLTETPPGSVVIIDISLLFNVTNEYPKARFELKNTSGDKLSDPTGIDFNTLHSDGFGGDPIYYITNPMAFLTDVISKYFTNDTITAKIYCGTSDTRAGLGTNPDSDTTICSSDSPHLEEIEIKGNFCNDPTECDNSGARLFKICNMTGNCSITTGETDIMVNNFDNTPPALGISEISNGDAPASSTYKRTDSSPLAAIENYIFKTFNIYDAETVDNASLHTNACGIPTGGGMTDYDDYFYEKTEGPNQICHPKQIPCAISSYQRGVREYTSDSGGPWVEIPEPNLICAQQCDVGQSPTFCSPADEIINGGDGVMRCCEDNACAVYFPLCFPFNVQ